MPSKEQRMKRLEVRFHSERRILHPRNLKQLCRIAQRCAQRHLYGENRIDDFIKLCMMRGWVVNRIDVENQIDIYNKAEEEIEF